MKDEEMQEVTRRKKVRTTEPNPDDSRATDLVERNFTAIAPNRLWIADFTYCPTAAGTVYVALCVDVFSQMILGWHAATTKTMPLVLEAVKMAIWQRERLGHHVDHTLVHHSDAGSQYTARKFVEHIALQGISPSIGSVGDAYDNALMEAAPHVKGRRRPQNGARRPSMGNMSCSVQMSRALI